MSDDPRTRIARVADGLPEGRVVRDRGDTYGIELDWVLYGDVYLMEET